jgi:hypothetical protein
MNLEYQNMSRLELRARLIARIFALASIVVPTIGAIAYLIVVTSRTCTFAPCSLGFHKVNVDLDSSGGYYLCIKEEAP